MDFSVGDHGPQRDGDIPNHFHPLPHGSGNKPIVRFVDVGFANDVSIHSHSGLLGHRIRTTVTGKSQSRQILSDVMTGRLISIPVARQA